MIFRGFFEIQTKTLNYVNITKELENLISKSKIREGICSVFLQGTTAGLMVNEMDHFLMEDFRRFFREIVNENRMYSHEDNAYSHLRASLLSIDKSFPVSKGKLVLGQWQSILLWEFDTRDRTRKIIVTLIGDP